jgi:hypothetical protein
MAIIKVIRGAGKNLEKPIKIKSLSAGAERLIINSGDEWIRTTDSRIFSPMLYQLSYITVDEDTKVA